jgi:hypothetical protein
MTAPKGRTYDRAVPVASSVATEHLARGGVPHMSQNPYSMPNHSPGVG